MLESIGGNDLRNLLAVYVRKLPIDLRTYLLPFIYGLLGGLAAVAFQKAASVIFSIFWERPSQQMPPGSFALFSLVTILTASIIAETTPIGIVTLHDVLRLQHQLSDAASL
jgi:hypothetical protein